MYQVTVKAEVADDENPRHATTREVTVTVINVHEAPVFAKTTDTLDISENPDDPEKEATSGRGELYLLNRGVGKPAANLPVEPNLDVGIPMVAVDDDNTWVAVDYTGGEPNRDDRPVQLIDGLTYTLSGADAKPFHIVPATGQILTREKLDYEAKKTYKMMVKATDPWGLSGSIGLTINVTDIDEQPIPQTLGITGDSSPQYAENGTDPVGEYTATAYGVAVANPAWTLGGADASHFRLDGTGNSRMLKFKSAPDYDAMADANKDNGYEVTLNVKDPSNRATPGSLSVTVEVTDVDELGALSGPGTASISEGATDALGTYTVSGVNADKATWDLDGADKDHFMLDGTGTTRMLKFKSAPDYEMPRGKAMSDTNTNEYMVTVMAENGGEMEMEEVTVTVDDVEELGTLEGNASISYDENDTGDVGTYTTTGPDTATWSLDGDDADDFSLSSGGVLTFSASPDFEAPADANKDNDYMVTVMASAGGEMAMQEVTVMVDNVEEAGAVTLNPTRPSVGTPITASLEDSDIVEGTVSWQWASVR